MWRGRRRELPSVQDMAAIGELSAPASFDQKHIKPFYDEFMNQRVSS